MMRVGLLDQSFRPDLGSTRWRLPAAFQFVRDPKVFDGPVLFVDGHALQPDECEAPAKIAWLHEPPCLGEMHRVYNDIMHISHRYDQVLTYDAALLALDPKRYHFLPYGGSWIDDRQWHLWPKTGLCSLLVGNKLETAGHKLRIELAGRLADLVDLFGARGVKVGYERGTKFKVNAPYAFSVVTETCRRENLFTEWLIDCFAVGTIPIFWGCPNVGDFFDARGVLSFETADEAESIVRGLNMRLYAHLLPYARTNQQAAQFYACPDDWLFDHYLRAYANLPARAH